MRSSHKVTAKSHIKPDKTTLLHDELGQLTIKGGLTSKQINELINYAKSDKAVKTYTLDPKRFRNKQTYEQWLKMGRCPYSLCDRKGSLLGLIWFRHKDIPKVNRISDFRNLDTSHYQITLAIRTYGSARGKGLARQLILKAFQLYSNTDNFKNILGQGVWLTTSINNTPAVNTYKNLFTQISDPDDRGKIIMVFDPKTPGLVKEPKFPNK